MQYLLTPEEYEKLRQDEAAFKQKVEANVKAEVDRFLGLITAEMVTRVRGADAFEVRTAAVNYRAVVDQAKRLFGDVQINP
jgi:hypothetical protein